MEKNNEAQEERTIPRRLKVLVAIDASKISDLVVKRSGQFTKATNCDLTILNVVEDAISMIVIPDTPLYNEKKKKAEEVIEKAEKTLKSHLIECKTRLTVGPIAAEIVRIAKEGEFDVIFMGSRGLGDLKRMLVGSVADSVVRHAHCAVTILR